MTSLSAEKPHDMIIGRAKRGQISRTDSEFFNGIGRFRPPGRHTTDLEREQRAQRPSLPRGVTTEPNPQLPLGGVSKQGTQPGRISSGFNELAPTGAK